MSEFRTIDEYALIYFLINYRGFAFNPELFDESFLLDSEFKSMMTATILNNLKKIKLYDAFPSNYEIITNKIIDDLKTLGYIESEYDDFTGNYYKIYNEKFISYIDMTLKSSNIYNKYNKIGDRFFTDVFYKFVNSEENNKNDRSDFNLSDIPASDRLVTLGHNAVGEIDGLTTKLIDLIENDTEIAQDLSLKQQFVGQLKAGRELIREKTFSVYLMHQTVLTLLGRLIDRYKNGAIAESAKVLFALLIEHVFTDI